MNEEVKVIGDLKITKRSGGNDKHSGFWHRLLGCHIEHSETETIHCSPPYTIYKNYYKCGYWTERIHEKVKAS